MPKFNNNQLKQLAEFMSNLSLVFFATSIAPVFSEFDKINPFMIALGLVLTAAFLIASLLILEGKTNVKS